MDGGGSGDYSDGQTVGWIKMPIGKEVGHVVLDGR